MKKGQRVRTTPYAIINGVYREHKRGYEIPWKVPGKRKYFIRVLVDGRITTDRFSPVFWEYCK